LTQEPTLEPELPICDAHHHLWEFRPAPVPYQRYLLAELAEDLGSGHNVRATVFIEVKERYRPDGPEEMRPVEVDAWAFAFRLDRTEGRADERGQSWA
jgi:predicted TIM-barrel fold metal-dependent hydrolase